MGELKGRVALITGASGALGTATTNAFLAAGARVHAVARRWRDVRTADRIAYLEADFTQPGTPGKLMARVLESSGRLDALVHVAGGWAGGEPVAALSDDAFEAMLSINLHAAFRMIRAALAPMIEQRRGRILAVGSRAAGSWVSLKGPSHFPALCGRALLRHHLGGLGVSRQVDLAPTGRDMLDRVERRVACRVHD
jgi:NAD(P)-dependent dehydrogenase (short-subunit alcohol dehydrogenase family)